MFILITTETSGNQVIGAELLTEARAMECIGNLHITRLAELANGTIIIETTGGCFRRFFDPA